VHQCAISAKDIKQQYKPLPTSPKGEENKLLEFTAYHLSFIIFHLAVLPRIEDEFLAAKVQCSKFNVQSVG